MKSSESIFDALSVVSKVGSTRTITLEQIDRIRTDARSDLLDRIKVLEGEVSKWEEGCRYNAESSKEALRRQDEQRLEILSLKSLLHRCLNTGLRSDKTRPIYLEVCKVLGVDPDKPWEEK